MTWTDKQLQEERQMSRLGEDRYKSQKQYAINKEKETRIPPVKKLLEQAVHRMSTEVEAFLKKEKAKRTKRHPMVAIFKEIPVDVACLLTCKTVLDKLSHEQDLNAAVRAVGAALEDEVAYRAISKADPKHWRALKDRYVDSKLRSSARQNFKEKWIWGTSKRYRAGLWCVHLMLDTTKLFEKLSYTSKKRTKILIRPTEETLKWLRDADETYEGLRPFYMPTTAPPRDWVDGKDGGYTTPLVHTKTFVKTHHKVGEKLISKANLGVLDKAVNKLQRVPWKINTKVLEVFEYFSKLDTSPVDLPMAHIQDLPPRPPDDSPAEDWKLWKRDAAIVHRYNQANTGKYLKAQSLRQIAKGLSKDVFYFPHRLDFRGRVYPLPNYLNIQGDDLAKGLLLFGKSEPIGDGEISLAIHTANVWDQDKLSLQDRIEWYYKNQRMLVDIGKDPYSNLEWANQKKPWQCLAAAFEVYGFVQSGKTFLTSLPVGADCTNNGLQMYSLLMADPLGAYWTNCTPIDKRLDIYQEVANATVIPPCWKGILDVVPRECAKRPVMTLAYGASKHSCRKYVIQWFEETYLDPLGNGNPFGRELHYGPCAQLADNLWAAIGTKIGKALEVMDWLREIAFQFDTGIHWTSPSGLPVYQRRETSKSKQVKTKVGHTVRVARFRRYSGYVHHNKMQDALPPNFIHSLDASVVHQVASGFSGPLGSVHDSFLTLAPHLRSLKNSVRYEVAAMFNDTDILHNLYQELVQQSRKNLPEPPAKDEFNVLDVIKAPYFIS